jgi:protoporphyrinogen oxidase
LRIAVLGAGVAGLVAALRLTEAGHTVDVYERWPGLGGQAATLDVGQGHLLERYYHHLFSTDRHIAALYDELGMEDELDWITSSVAYFTQGKQWPFVTPMDLLRFKPMPLLARLRLGVAVLAIQRGPGNPAPFERVTARKWIERYMGRDAYRTLWGPLLRGKFGERADDIAMVWLQNKLRLRRGDDAKEEKLGYPKRSWEPLFTELRSRIEAGDTGPEDGDPHRSVCSSKLMRSPTT